MGIKDKTLMLDELGIGRSFWQFPCPDLPKRYVKDLIFEAWGSECVYCRTRAAQEVDHILARHHGGPEDLANFTATCIPCNKEKRRYHLRGDLLVFTLFSARKVAPEISRAIDAGRKRPFKSSHDDENHSMFRDYMKRGTKSIVYVDLSWETIEELSRLDPRPRGSRAFSDGRTEHQMVVRSPFAAQEMARKKRPKPVVVYNRYESTPLSLPHWGLQDGVFSGIFRSDFFTAINVANETRLKFFEIDGDGRSLPNLLEMYRPLAGYTPEPNNIDIDRTPIKRPGWLIRK